MANKKALCVGINNFKNLPSAKLHGCVNDANDMAAFLVSSRGYAKGDVTVLTDAGATKAAVIDALNALVAGARAGAISEMVFSFSSHGTQVPDLDGDEQPEAQGSLKGKRADEAFCPYDLIQKGDTWDKEHIITDDELHNVFVQVPESCRVEVFMDTCHSGTALKVIDLLGFPDMPKPRFLPPPSLKAFKALGMAKAKPLPRSIFGFGKAKLKGATLWSGCRSDQTSADATFNGRGNGAFTRNYIDIAQANPSASPKVLLGKLRSALKRGGFSQIAQLEENATQR